MSDLENGEEAIDESGRNPTQQRIDEGGPKLSEVIPEDPDREGGESQPDEGGDQDEEES